MSVVGDYPRTPVELVDNTKVSRVFDDFMEVFDSSKWLITKSRSVNQVTHENAIHGELLLANLTLDTDFISMQLGRSVIKFVSGKETFFKARIRLNEVTQSIFLCGLMIVDPSPLDATDGVYFKIEDEKATIDVYVKKDSTASSKLSLATIPAETLFELAFLYDGMDEIVFFVNSVRKGSLGIDNLPDDELLTPTIYIGNGQAASSAVTFDFYEAGQER